MIIKTLQIKYKEGDVVYLKTDVEQLPRMVITITWSSNCEYIMYTLMQGATMSIHYGYEIESEVNITLKTGN